MPAPVRQTCDVLIRDGCVLTMNCSRAIYWPGAIAIRGPCIVAVGRDAELAQAWHPTREIAAQGAIVHPGFIDAHLHVNEQTCRGYFRGDTSKGGQPGPNYADWKAAIEQEENAAE